MVRNRASFPRRFALACAAAISLAGVPAQAQLVGGGVAGMQAVQAAQNPGTAVLAQPSSSYSNPYSNTGVAMRPAINSQGDPYAGASGQGVVTGQYAAPLGTASSMPDSGMRTQAPQNGAEAVGASPGYYGGSGEPAAAPRYSVQAQPQAGPYAPPAQEAAPQPYSVAPDNAPPRYAPAPPLRQPYAPPPPEERPAPGPAPAAMAASPGNPIPSPYAAAATRAAAVSAGPVTEGGYTLGPGDKLRLTIFGETDLSGEYQLDGNGNIRIPLAGVVHAGGATPQVLEAAIRTALVPNYLRNPRINVEVISYRPIYVLGQVQKPGQYAYVNDMTVLNAIGLAGGFTQQAKESILYIRHEGEAAEQQVSSGMPLLIRPGDSIRVDTTLFWDAMNMFSPLAGPAALTASALH